MTLTAQATPTAAPQAFLRSTIGRKIVMAVTGVILVGFVIAHMTGNLLVFLGPEAIRNYALWLRAVAHGAGLWIARAVLLASVLLHIWAAASLTLASRRARRVRYQEWQPRASTLYSRTMRWTGVLLLAYIVYHLLHMTFGIVHPDFVELQPYHNLVVGFRDRAVAVTYIVAMILLAFHLDHGIWSMVRTLGLSHPRYVPMVRKLSVAIAVIVALGYISIPVAVLAGVLR
ncbi:MAG TPA: succinate dehydrogenase cytochrome b subunit [Gemmatimonadales bacterium]|jgi:succinate dehydrogenase / fumarate reductase cytochrome b subunit